MAGIINTIKQNCRRCYTCVRDCPAKAIRIEDGQASVVADRCISCGNCTMVCSQDAKAYKSGIEGTLAALDRGIAAALLAPSFPAGFTVPAEQVIGALRRAGFQYVVEVAYGADVVNQACHRYLAEHPTGLHIASACPAVVEYVRKYHPELTDCIMPIVSPMVATGLAVKNRYGQHVQCIFIGPCVAKKAEIRDPEVVGVIDEVLTLVELERVFMARGVDPATTAPSDFDPPHAGKGRIYPIPGGMFESAGIGEGILDPRLIVVSGKDETVEALNRMPDPPDDRLLLVEALMCHGCYAGPGVKSDEPGVLRRRRVAEFAADSLHRQKDGSLPDYDPEGSPAWLGRHFEPFDQRSEGPMEEEIREILAHTNKFFPEDELNCGACGYSTCREKAKAVYAGMAEETMCLPFIIDQAERVCHELNVPWSNLRDVHRHLINSEKLASMGQMAAGVAHELNNPLSTILLYSHILQRKLDRLLKDDVSPPESDGHAQDKDAGSGNSGAIATTEDAILRRSARSGGRDLVFRLPSADREDLDHDLKLMAEESERCKKIIGNLLDFARQSRVRIEPVSLEELVASAADGAACNLPPSGDSHVVEIATDVTPGLSVDLDRDQMTQVLVNLIKNGVEAMEGRSGTVRVSARPMPETNRVRFSVSDEGSGVSAAAKDKVFQPFFTTKSIGKGTGLGLPISYGIVKMHNGNIWFDSEPGAGTTFYVEIPMTRASGERSSK